MPVMTPTQRRILPIVEVSQDSRRVEVYSRDEQQSNLWHYREYGTGGQVTLPSLGIAIDVDVVYANPLA